MILGSFRVYTELLNGDLKVYELTDGYGGDKLIELKSKGLDEVLRAWEDLHRQVTDRQKKLSKKVQKLSKLAKLILKRHYTVILQALYKHYIDRSNRKQIFYRLG